MENGYQIFHMEFKESLQGKFTYNSCKRISKVLVRFCGCIIGQIRQGLY
jgi:hypothetical protein